jgi:CheY-like chemotaxis protein
MWQALLKSQKLAVILEPASGDLADCINQIAVAGLTLPDVIVLDAEAANLNPYEFCRWCRDAFPQIQIFLTRCRQLHISDTERRWAKQQGATDLLNGFERESLMSGAADNVKRILNSLDYPFLNEKALLTVLLNIRRQLNTTQAPEVASSQGSRSQRKGSDRTATGLTTVRGEGSKEGDTSSDPLHDLDWVTSGLRALGKSLTGSAPKETFIAPPPATKSSALPDKAAADQAADGTKVRRYRGVVY